MKIIVSFFTLMSVLVFISCNHEIEPLEMQVNGIEKKLDQIKAYKTTHHPIMLVWSNSWKADGNMNTYLNTLPDSVDIIIVGNISDQITSSQIYDLQTVRLAKGTKVIPHINFETWANEYSEKLEEVQDHDEENAVELLNQKYSEKWEEILKSAWDLAKSTQYDGISIRISDSRNEFIHQKITLAINELGGKYGKQANNKIMVMEGNLHRYSTCFRYFNYLVHTAVNPEKISYLEEDYAKFLQYPNFDSKSLLLFFSMTNSSWQIPYPDIISSQSLNDPKYKTLAYWCPVNGDNIGGMAIHGIEKNSDQNYSVVRSSISYLNLK